MTQRKMPLLILKFSFILRSLSLSPLFLIHTHRAKRRGHEGGRPSARTEGTRSVPAECQTHSLNRAREGGGERAPSDTLQGCHIDGPVGLTIKLTSCKMTLSLPLPLSHTHSLFLLLQCCKQELMEEGTSMLCKQFQVKLLS